MPHRRRGIEALAVMRVSVLGIMLSSVVVSTPSRPCSSGISRGRANCCQVSFPEYSRAGRKRQALAWEKIVRQRLLHKAAMLCSRSPILTVR